MIHKIDKAYDSTLEVLGLKAQYLIILIAMILLLFALLFVALSFNISIIVAILFSVTYAIVLYFGLFYLSDKYGQYGIIKMRIRFYLPRYLLFRKTLKIS